MTNQSFFWSWNCNRSSTNSIDISFRSWSTFQFRCGNYWLFCNCLDTLWYDFPTFNSNFVRFWFAQLWRFIKSYTFILGTSRFQCVIKYKPLAIRAVRLFIDKSNQLGFEFIRQIVVCIIPACKFHNNHLFPDDKPKEERIPKCIRNLRKLYPI